MSDTLPPSVAIAIATVTTSKPPSEGGEYHHLIGVALFEVEEGALGDFLYRLQVRTAPAGTSEAMLAEWLTPRLPSGRTAIGWQLAEHIVPALLEASDAATPAATRDFVDALAAMVTIDAVDLADQFGGVAAPAFKEVCAAEDIPASAMSEAETLAAWAIDRRIELVAMLANNVVAAWRLWAKTQRHDDDAPQRFAADVLAHWRIDSEGTIHSWQEEGGDDDAAV